MSLFDPIRRSALVAALLLAPGLARPAAAQQAPAAPQTGVIRGTIIDSTTRGGVPSVQVQVLGTERRTLANQAGSYTLRDVPAGQVTVRVQRIGFAPAERRLLLVAGDTLTADFALRPVAVTLGAVVSIGYGTANRANVTSATSSVSAEDIANTPVAGIDAALQGKLPGVQVSQNAGNPGNGISIRVRGPASVNAGNQPLYVVDGVPIIQENYTQLGLGGQDITAVTGLNPDEIATIDVLKDAAAAAIYGSRGSNGVVIVTTKRGQAGKTRFTFNSYIGRQDDNRRIGLLNAKQYVEVMNESAANDGYEPDEYDFTPGTDDAKSFDWQDAVFRTAPVSDVQLGVSGGGDRATYYLSGSNFDQRGIVIGSGYKRQAGRLNVDFTATDRLFFRTSIGITREDNDRIEGDGSLDGVLTNAIGMQPMRPLRGTASGFGGEAEDLRYSNPLALAAFNSTKLNTQRVLGNIEARLGFGPSAFLTGRLGADFYGVDELQWLSPKVDQTYAAGVSGVGKSGHANARKYLAETFLTVQPVRNAEHDLSVVVGTSGEFNRSDLNFIRGEGFTGGFTTYIRNAANITSYDGAATENNLVSVFTRADYSLRQRYQFSASVRTDGSSRFGENARYGSFPAASVGWVLTDESFARGLSRYATLKLRASAGSTGNQGIGDFASLSLATGAPYAGVPGIAPSSLGNPDLRWEKTREFNEGLDLALFRGRIGIIADVYQRHTTDLLVRRPISAVSGYTSIWGNVGDITNNGVDLGLMTVNVEPQRPNGFSWTSGLNLTFNRNRVTALFNDQPFTTGINGRESSIVAVGQPIGAFYMLKFDGVDPATGDAIIRDVNGDGDITSADRMVVGSPHPKYFGGFSNTIGLAGLELRSFLQFSVGNDVFNMMRIFTDDGGCSYDNKSTAILGRWKQPGDITNVPRMSYDCESGADLITSRFIEDGSYLRIGEISLSYGLPDRWSGLLRMSNARFTLSGRNLHTFTKYTGYNPDVNSAGSDSNVISGTDYYAYPIARTFSFGISGGW